jgi:putative endonuclease
MSNFRCQISNKNQNYNKGKSGEEMAKEFLMKKGFSLIEQNYENRIGEIDLIMSYRDWLVFVEVKLKVGDRFGIPEEMIGKRKLSQIKKVAESFLFFEKNKIKKFEKFRIDAVCLVVDEENGILKLNHYENIY